VEDECRVLQEKAKKQKVQAGKEKKSYKCPTEGTAKTKIQGE
jgi:hypothetical protein